MTGERGETPHVGSESQRPQSDDWPDDHALHAALPERFAPMCAQCQSELARAFTLMADKPGAPRDYPTAVLMALAEVRATDHVRRSA